MAARATRYLRSADELLLADLILAEAVYVLESFYEAPRPQVAEAMRSVMAFPAITVLDKPLLLRAIEVYEVDRLDFAEAYLVACAETSGVDAVASFDKAVSRVTTVQHIVP
jgi:predicted nucleic-acid-binding protein